ncbi:large ribosomal subunit protein mL38 isoform X2 [Pogona vitticeps]
MALPAVKAVLHGVRRGRSFSTTALLCLRGIPLGPMPNEDIDVSNLEALEKYRVFTRYFKVAEEKSKEFPWWSTYKKHITPQQVLIPLDDVKAEWERTSGPYHKQRVAEHYGLYRDLFGDATFLPQVILRVEYSQDEEHVTPVYCGNLITPTEALNPPEVSFEADEGSLWTLLLTNLDGHLRDTNLEYVHWLVANIPGNRIEEGEEICHYFPAFPAKGTGYHRYVFLLFKQDQQIDFTEDVRPKPCHSLNMRSFKTFDFYKKHQSDMTPAGLAFFQCHWDDSVTKIFHQVLDMKEPVFDFVRPPPYHPPQKRFPHRQPLRYLDRYRDSDEPVYKRY